MSREETINGKRITWLAVKHSFWGDIAFHLGRYLGAKGFPVVVFVGKLGSLKGNDVPNATIVTGSESQVGRERVTWVNVFGNSSSDVREGRHITVDSVLDESVSWREQARADYDFVDPEVGQFAAGVASAGGAFGYLHIVSDNLSAKYDEDLSNERDRGIPGKRLALYGRIGEILRRRIATL